MGYLGCNPDTPKLHPFDYRQPWQYTVTLSIETYSLRSNYLWFVWYETYISLDLWLHLELILYWNCLCLLFDRMKGLLLPQVDSEERTLMEAEKGNLGGVVNHLYLWTPTCRHGWKNGERKSTPPVQTPVDATKPDVYPALQLNSVDHPQDEKNKVKVEEPSPEALNDTSVAT